MRCGVTLSQIADGDSFISWQGDSFNIIYSPVLEDGCIKLIESGREDIATLINSYADQCDMSVILSRLKAGDSSVLYARQGFYGDFSACTYDHAAMLQTVIDAHNAFDHLPSSVRSRFHDSFHEWFSTAGSPDWVKSMSSASNPASVSMSSDVSGADLAQASADLASQSSNFESGDAK